MATDFTVPVSASRQSEEWYDVQAEAALDVDATHWMPLPLPPQDKP